MYIFMRTLSLVVVVAVEEVEGYSLPESLMRSKMGLLSGIFIKAHFLIN